MTKRTLFYLMVIVAFVACSKPSPAPAGGEDAAPPKAGAAKAGGPATARELLIAYAAEKDCRARGPFLVNPASNLPLLLAKAGPSANCSGASSYTRIDDTDCGEAFDKHPPPAVCSAYLVYTNPDERSLYSVVKTAAGLKIDWRSSVGYNPMTLAAFRAKQPAAALPFRVKIKLTDYFNFDFRSAKATHYSIDVSDEDGGHIAGYIAKSSPDAEALFKVVEDAKEHYAVLELQYPPGAKSDNALITRFFHQYWQEGADGF